MSELIYGRRAVREALRAQRRRIFRLWYETSNEAKPGGIIEEICQAAAEQNIAVRPLQGGIFDKFLRDHVNAQGVALEVDGYPYVTVEESLRHAIALREPPLLLILDHLQDPQNLGTLMRTAEALGVHGIIIPDRRAAAITPAVSNASAGAVEHLLVAQVNNINRIMEDLKTENIWIAGLDSGDDVPLLEQANLSGALAVVVGNEGEGLSHLTRERCDFLVRLSMFGQIASLNAAVAGSIVLYAARQARLK